MNFVLYGSQYSWSHIGDLRHGFDPNDTSLDPSEGHLPEIWITIWWRTTAFKWVSLFHVIFYRGNPLNSCVHGQRKRFAIRSVQYTTFNASTTVYRMTILKEWPSANLHAASMHFWKSRIDSGSCKYTVWPKNVDDLCPFHSEKLCRFVRAFVVLYSSGFFLQITPQVASPYMTSLQLWFKENQKYYPRWYWYFLDHTMQ